MGLARAHTWPSSSIAISAYQLRRIAGGPWKDGPKGNLGCGDCVRNEYGSWLQCSYTDLNRSESGLYLDVEEPNTIRWKISMEVDELFI